MKLYVLFFSFFLAMICAIVSFLFSCVVTLTDGQGALIFIFTIPIILASLAIAYYLGKRMAKRQGTFANIHKLPLLISITIFLFFFFSFIPIFKSIPDSFLKFVGVTFESMTGMSPRLYFKAKRSFPYLLSEKLTDASRSKVDFAELAVTFAWDKVCIFGPYTNKEKASSVLNIEFNIEERSEIHFSDSMNALVFLFEGKVNQVVDLKKSIVDFSDLDLCYERNRTNFDITYDANGRRILQ